MGRIVVMNHVTLDGVMQGPGRPDEDTRGGFTQGGWGQRSATAGDAAEQAMGERMAAGGGLAGWLFGRRTYEELLRTWNARGGRFKDALNTTPKYVDSTTLQEPLPWPNSTLLHGDMADAVRALKAETSGVLAIMGSGVLIGSLMAAGSMITRHPAHAASPLRAVKMVLQPYDPRNHGKYNFSNCTTLSPRRYSDLTCPETPRLLHYLSIRRLPRSDSGLPFCRCQSGVHAVYVLAVRFNNDHVARVDARWDFGPAGSTPPHTYATDTFVVLRQAGGWLIDDEYCTGRPATSVYKGIAGQTPCYRH